MKTKQTSQPASADKQPTPASLLLAQHVATLDETELFYSNPTVRALVEMAKSAIVAEGGAR